MRHAYAGVLECASDTLPQGLNWHRPWSRAEVKYPPDHVGTHARPKNRSGYEVHGHEVEFRVSEGRKKSMCPAPTEEFGEMIEDLKINDLSASGISDDHAWTVHGARQSGIDMGCRDLFCLGLRLFICIVEASRFRNPPLR
jgi:hypothetical protein